MSATAHTPTPREQFLRALDAYVDRMDSKTDPTPDAVTKRLREAVTSQAIAAAVEEYHDTGSLSAYTGGKLVEADRHGPRRPSPRNPTGAEAMTWVYIQSEPALYTVGFYKPDGGWEAESDHGTSEGAAKRVRYLNGGREAP